MKEKYISKETLENLHKEGFSRKAIAIIFNVDFHTIDNKFKKYGISRKKMPRPGLRKFFGTKEELEKLYLQEDLSQYQIAIRLKISRSIVKYWTKKFGITSRHDKHTTGKRNGFYGKNHSIDTKKKIGKANTGNFWDRERIEVHRTKIINRWKNPEYRERNLHALRESWKKRPTKPELLFEKICVENNFPLIYVGDGKYSIDGFNPDFIDATGRHLAVEVFGDYWHNPSRKGIESYELEPNRKAIFYKNGWELIVIWEHELKSPDNVINKLRKMYENIIVIPRI